MKKLLIYTLLFVFGFTIAYSSQPKDSNVAFLSIGLFRWLFAKISLDESLI